MPIQFSSGQLFLRELSKLRKLAIPIVIGQLGVVLMQVVDNVMIGRLLDKNALAAATLGNSLTFLLASFAIGGIPVLAPIFARKKKEEKQNFFQESSSAIIWFTLILTGLCLLVYWNFSLFDQPKSIEKEASFYFLQITLANIPLYLFLFYKQLLDSLHLAKIGMWITFFGLFCNILLNYLLIDGLFSWGLYGAGFATIITRLVMLFLMHYATIQKFEAKWRIKSMEKSKALLSTLFYSGSHTFFEIGAFVFAVIMMGWINETALASHQIAINLASIAYMIATGVAYAGGIRIGEEMKKKRTGLVAGNAALLSVFVLMLISATIFLAFNASLAAFYTKEIDLIMAASELLIIAAFFQVSDGVQAVALGCLRGYTDVKIPSLITFVSYWILALPLGYYLAFVMNYQAEGIWWGLLIGLSVAALILTWRFWFLSKKNITYHIP